MEELPDSELKRMGGAELERRIEQQIVLGTWGRIHNLRVEVTEGRVVVRGRTPSQYVKQLVLQAVLDVLGPTDSTAVELDIQVGPGNPPVLQGKDDLWGVPRF